MEFVQEPSGADKPSGVLLRPCPHEAHKGMSAASELA